MRPVEPGIRLYNFNIVLHRLINIHGAQLRLVKACLVLVCHDKHAVLLLIEGTLNGDINVVHVVFGVVVILLDHGKRILQIVRIRLELTVIGMNCLFTVQLAGEGNQWLTKHLEAQIAQNTVLIVFRVSVKVCGNGVFVADNSGS